MFWIKSLIKVVSLQLIFMAKNILMVTQEYPAVDNEKEFTPVVHFFTKEWVKQGYRVVVLNMPTNFPSLMYRVARLARRRLESKVGTNFRTYKLSEVNYDLDGVCVARIPLRKNKPHGRFSRKEIRTGIEKAVAFCEKEHFKPDVIIGHWVNPSAEIMLGLKKVYNVPCALSMHDTGTDFRNLYQKEQKEMFKEIDCWGFRSIPIQRHFEEIYGRQEKEFVCFSGVPEEYIVKDVKRDFTKIKKFLFVGLLIKRKHPFEYVQALDKSEVKDFTLEIIGQGDEATPIKQYISEHPELTERVRLLGRIPRNEVSLKMQQSDVFCMISNHETFGLVYIEAMAAGCITIASKNEGFDGIIIDGENGFLCEAGNVEELTSILNRINKMEKAELNRISENAIKTASLMTDSKVAASYIHAVEKLLNV